jgi:hypothetical protein
MLTREDYKKLGLPYVDQSQEASRINLYTDSLYQRLNNLQAIIPFVTSVPQDSQSTGKPGNIAIDSEYFYICTETNNWKRIPLNEI